MVRAETRSYSLIVDNEGADVCRGEGRPSIAIAITG